MEGVELGEEDGGGGVDEGFEVDEGGEGVGLGDGAFHLGVDGFVGREDEGGGALAVDDVLPGFVEVGLCGVS